MLGEWFQKHVLIEYSPFLEMVASLHVLMNPEHHLARLSWAQEARSHLSSALIPSLDYLGQASNDWLNLYDLHVLGHFHENSVEEGIEKLQAVNEQLFVYCLLGCAVSEEKISQILQGNQTYPSEFTQPQLDFMHKPTAFKQKMVDALFNYHRNFFAPELRRVEPWLIRFVHNFKEHLAKNPVATMESIHPRLIIRDQEIQFLKAHTWRFFYTDIAKILIQPSTFISPHLLLGSYLSIISIGHHVPVPGFEQTDAMPADLLATMKALSDETRMRILRQLFYHPYCTQQLADMYSLAEATVSKHLRILTEAGLVRSERRGNFVFYSGNKEKIQMVRVDLDQFFDQPILEDHYRNDKH